jgi:myo-inositol-1-phosphate synthase
MGCVNVALIGVGNNASALLQGWAHITGVREAEDQLLAGYRVRDLRFVCAFDVSREKVGRDISSALFIEPTNFPHIYPVPDLGVPVLPGIALDSIHDSVATLIPALSSQQVTVDSIAAALRASQVDVVVNFLPSGSPEAARFYASAAARASCAYINATPDPAVHDQHVVAMFEDAGVPLLGDDLESQMGATVMHRAILETLKRKGLRIVGSYQINVGGNMDFRNLAERREAKQRSKRRGLRISDAETDIHVVPAVACFPFLGDRKVAHILVETEGWLGSRNQIEVRLEIQDSSSAASVVADLIRIAKFELDAGRSGIVDDAGFYFKNPRDKQGIDAAELLLARYRM